METSAVPARLIGAIFVEKGLISEDDLEHALEAQKRLGGRLGEILVAEFGVSRLDLASALADQWSALERPARARPVTDEADAGAQSDADLAAVSAEWARAASDEPPRRPIGEIFVEQGTISAEQLEHALAAQRETGQRLGEVLVAQGVLSRLELASALADQWASLQKLRPPAPPDPHGRLRAPGSEGEESVSSDAVDDLRAGLDALRAELAERAQAFESASVRASQTVADLATELPPLAGEVEALGSRIDALGSRLAAAEGLAGRVGALEAADATAGVREEIDALSVRIEKARDELVEAAQDRDGELRRQIDELAARLGEADALAARISALEERDEGAELREDVASIQAMVADLGERVVETADRTGEAELRGRVDELERDRSSSDIADRLDVLAGDLGARISAVEARDDGPRLDAVLSELERARLDAARIDELDRAIAELGDAVALASRADGEELRGAVEELNRRVSDAATEAELRDAFGSLTERFDAATADDRKLLARIAELEQRLTALAPLAALRGEVDERLGSLERLVTEASASADRTRETLGDLVASSSAELRLETEAALGGLRDRVEELRGRVDERGPVEDARVPALADRLEALERDAPRHDDLRERVAGELRAETEAALQGLRGEMAELRGRVDERGPVEDARVPALADRLKALERDAPRHDDLRERVAGELRAETQAALQGLRGEMAELHGRVDERGPAEDPRVPGLADRLEAVVRDADERNAALVGRLDSVAQAVHEAAASERELREHFAGDLRAETEAALRGHREAIEELRGRVENPGPAEDPRVPELGDRIQLLAQALGETTASEARLRDRLAGKLRAEATAAHEGLQGALDDLRERFEEGQRSEDPRVSELSGRVDELERSGGDRDARLADRLDEFEHRLHDHASRLDDTVHDRLAALAAEVHNRVDDVAGGIAAARDETARIAEARDRELVEREARWEERIAAVQAEIDERERALRDELGTREGLGEGDLDAMRAELEGLERRLDEQSARADEQVRVTERALREGLASLGGRLAESKDAFVQAGEALQRSVERLGSAVSEVDVRIAVREQGGASERAAEATAFVAFVPVSEGYRLVACEGAPPPVGGRLELEEVGGLVVTRIGPSPLPLDERPCVYLEQTL